MFRTTGGKEMKQLLYGGDYYPEQWLDRPELLEKDLEFMKEAKINLITIGVFAWSVLEPEEGKYNLDWLEGIINRLYSEGISIMLATPSGARPKWLSDRYPEVLRVNENRTRNLFGGRHNHCYTSPIYREKVRQINMALAKRFGQHPAIYMWHISNEFGGECHCPLCQKAFQKWLEAKYQTIEKLNQSWWTTFWSHRYNSFEQIESPSSIGERAIHGLNLDWKRFVTHQTIDFIREETRAIRDGGASQPTTTNFMYDFRGLNYGKLAKAIDVVSWDSYPIWHKGNDIAVARDNGMQHDYMRSLKHKPFLLMESCPTSTNWQGVSKLKKPGLLMNASLQAIAHGSDSVQYFQIRQSRGSSEKFHGAVIDHYGEKDTRVFQEITEVGNRLKELSELAGSQVNAKVALIYDVENRWAMEDSQGPRNKGLFYHEAALKSYEAFKRYGLDVDVIDMEQSLSHYKLLAVPMLYMFRANIEEKLREFVVNGGTLIMTYWSGIVNETDLCYLGGVPHGMMDVLGLRSEEIDGLYDDETNQVEPVIGNALGICKEYTCNHLAELVRVDKAEILMTFKFDFYSGKPALTRNKFGQGEAYYICADMEQDFYDDIYRRILESKNISSLLPGIPSQVDVTSRETPNYTYLFLQNYGQVSYAMKIPEGAEVIGGEFTGKLPGLSTLILRIAK